MNMFRVIAKRVRHEQMCLRNTHEAGDRDVKQREGQYGLTPRTRLQGAPGAPLQSLAFSCV